MKSAEGIAGPAESGRLSSAFHAGPTGSISQSPPAEAPTPSLWETHLATPLPDDCRGSIVEGIDLAVLAADATGGLRAFYAAGRALTAGHVARLGLCFRDLAVAGHLLGGEARAYFLRLEVLVGRALEECAARPVQPS